MKVAVGLGVSASSPAAWSDAETWVTEAERLGVDSAWGGETWGFDAFTPLAYLAAKTSRITLGCAIAQVGSRSPAVLAMTALSLASMTEGRFVLGLGTSGPQVIEGLHGVPFNPAYTRLRETVRVLRLAMAGERVAYEGVALQLPLPGRRPLRLSAPSAPVPIYLATLGPRSLRMTGELADGWFASSFMAEHAAVFLDEIRAGAAAAGRPFEAIDRQAGGVLQFGDDLDALIEPRKPGFAFEMGAMGSPEQNFYRDAYARQGYGDLAREVLRLWLDGKRDEAAALIPDEFVIMSNLLGTDDMVRARIRAYRDHGVTTLRVSPAGDTVAARLDTLGRFMDLVREVDAEPEPWRSVGDVARRLARATRGSVSSRSLGATPGHAPQTEDGIMTTDTAHETSVELTMDDLYVISADDIDAFAVNWNEEPSPPPFYVIVDGRKFAFVGQTYLVRGYGAELPDWVKAEDDAGHLVLFVERDDRLLAYSFDPNAEVEDDAETPAE